MADTNCGCAPVVPAQDPCNPCTPSTPVVELTAKAPLHLSTAGALSLTCNTGETPYSVVTPDTYVYVCQNNKVGLLAASVLCGVQQPAAPTPCSCCNNTPCSRPDGFNIVDGKLHLKLNGRVVGSISVCTLLAACAAPAPAPAPNPVLG